MNKPLTVGSDFESVTQKAFDENVQTLTQTGPEKPKRGRPKKIIIPQEEEEITCPKCHTDDPGDWSQCNKICPMPESPWYDISWMKANNNPFAISLPPDPWGTWKRSHFTETSNIFLTWFEDCKKIVLDGWSLKIRNTKKFIQIVMQNNEDKDIRPFAFIKKATGDIHVPATQTQPFDHFAGNISDPETRLSVIGPYGCITHWPWLPTHPLHNSLAISMTLEQSNNELENEDDDNVSE